MATMVDALGVHSDPLSLGVKYLLRMSNEETRKAFLSTVSMIPPSAYNYWRNLTASSSLPYGWARLWNLCFLILNMISLIGAASDQRLIISFMRGKVRKWTMIYKIYLILHTIYYIFELSLTSIYRFPSCLWHHIISITLFNVLFRFPEYYCVLLFIPFYIHSLAWVLNDAEDFTILFVYNLVSYTCILSGHILSIFMNDAPIKSISMKAHGTLAIATSSLVITNAWSYCAMYSDTLCGKINNSDHLGFNNFTMVISLCSILITVTFANFIIILIRKSKITAKGNRTISSTSNIKLE